MSQAQPSAGRHNGQARAHVFAPRGAMFRLVRVRRTGDFGWGVIVENGGSQLVSFHEARKDADRAARKIAGALKYRLAIDGES